MKTNIQEIKDLSIGFKSQKGKQISILRNITTNIRKGETVGIVGESGSGKSTVGNAIINLIDEPGKVSSGSILLGDINIHENPENIVKYRGNKVGLIFQDPQTSLNPIFTIGEQLIETIQTHLDLNTEEAKTKAAKGPMAHQR